MRLIYIDITNFGKLSNYHYTFNDTMNTICEVNGYGKTTIGAFIKVMFYGFYGENKKIKDRERTKYMPWNGKTFGGSIAFESKGKQYLLERTFGDKASQDFVSIKYLDTLLAVEEMNISQIGKELFDIDGDSFARTLLLSQNEYRENIKDSSTNDIDTKIGNLIDFSNDMNNYEEAKKTLEAKMSIIKTPKGKGSYDQNEKTIKELEYKVLNKANEELKRDDLEKEVSQLIHLKEIKNKLDLKKTYEDILVDYNSSRGVHDDTNQYFKQLPDLNELEGYIEKAENIPLLEEKIAENTLNEQEKQRLESYQLRFDPYSFDENINQTITEFNEASRFVSKFDLNDIQKQTLKEDEVLFKDGIDEERINNLQDKWIHKNDVVNPLSYQDHKMIEEGNRIFKEAVQEKEVEYLISLWKKREEYINQISDNQNKLNSMSSLIPCILLIAGILLSAIGIVVTILFKAILGIPLILVGIILALPGILSYRKYKRTIQRIQKRIKEYQSQIILIEKKVQDYLILYHKDYDLNNVIRDLRDLYKDYMNYVDLLEVSSQLENKEASKDVEKEVIAFLTNYHYSYNENKVVDDLSDIKHRYLNYIDLKKQSENKDLHQNKAIYMNTKTSIDQFFTNYGLQVDERNYFIAYQKLDKEYQNMNTLKTKESVRKKASEELKQLESMLKEYMNQYISINSDSLSKQLDDMQNKMIAYHTNEENYQRDLKAKLTFESENPDYQNLLNFDCPTFSYEGSIESLMEQIHFKQTELEKQNNLIDDIENKEGQIIYLQQENQQLNAQYHLLKSTLHYLSKAKESLDKQYRKPLENALKRYLDLLVEHTDLKIEIDVHKHMTFKEDGHPCEYHQLSQGYRDLVDLCFRFALIDAMYKKEKPMIVLDDPLINLDDQKVEKGLSLLRDLSRQYQILYLTCHTSRKEK